MTATTAACYCSSLAKSVYASKDAPAPRCDFCAGIRKAPELPSECMICGDGLEADALCGKPGCVDRVAAICNQWAVT